MKLGTAINGDTSISIIDPLYKREYFQADSSDIERV